MTSDSDDLEQALQQNLQIRRKLGAELGKVDGIQPTKQVGGIVYRLGWVLYWSCLAMAAVPAFISVIALLTQLGVYSQNEFPSDHILGGALMALVLYGIGRAFRHVLSGE